MQKSVSSGLDLKIFAWIGLAVMVALMVFPFVLGYFAVVAYRSDILSAIDKGLPADTGLLGELGSRCGGPDRLPCRPGLECSELADPAAYGRCIRPAWAGARIGQLNDACGEDLPDCAAGLFCKNPSGAEAKGTCSTIDTATDPHIVSVKLDGMSPDNGVYHAVDGTNATVRIQALNADRVSVRLKPKEGAAGTTSTLGEVVKAEGGLFTAALEVRKGLDADLVVTARNDKGEFSAVSVAVAANE
jgi:hypothetical protein